MSRTPARTAETNTKAYLRTKVLTAGPAELRLMLFDGALKFAEKGRQGLADRDYEAAYEGISRCQQIILELINGLRPVQDPQLCNRLSGLYTFLYRRLIDASRERSPAIIAEVIKLLEYERQTWALLMDKLADENPRPGARAADGSVRLEG
jgi:flagellar protein FliS